MSPAEPPRASKAAPTTPLDALVARQMAPGDHQDPSGDVLGSMFLRFGGRNRRQTDIIDIAEAHLPFLLMRFFILFLLRLLLRTHIIIIRRPLWGERRCEVAHSTFARRSQG